MSPAWSPKRWRRPGSAKWKDWIAERGVPLTLCEIVKGLWPQSILGPHRVRPKWAEDAWKRGWLRTAEYIRLPMEHWVEVPGMYDESPYLAMIPRSNREDDERQRA